MQKFITLQIFLFALLGTGAYAQNDAELFWRQNVVPHIMNQENISFQCADWAEVFAGGMRDRSEADTLNLVISPSGKYITNGVYYARMTSDSLFVFDIQSGNYSYGTLHPKNGNNNAVFYMKDQTFGDLFYYARYYMEPADTSSFNYPFLSMRDTVEAGKSYKVMRYAQQAWSEIDPQTRELIPIYDTVDIYVNSASMDIDKTVVYQTSRTQLFVVYFLFDSISYGEPTIDHGLYTISNPIYEDYPVYDINQEMAPSWASYRVEDDDVDKFLHYPLVNAGKDTVTLAQSNGWVLVEMWMFGCRGCVQYTNQLAHEQDSLGYRELEAEGIKLMCINSSCRATDAFVQYVNSHRIADIAYAARGIDSTMNMKKYPYFLLISPQKEIIYRQEGTRNLYSNIRNAIAKHKK